jgi:hypothetical protein
MLRIRILALRVCEEWSFAGRGGHLMDDRLTTPARELKHAVVVFQFHLGRNFLGEAPVLDDLLVFDAV